MLKTSKRDLITFSIPWLELHRITPNIPNISFFVSFSRIMTCIRNCVLPHPTLPSPLDWKTSYHRIIIIKFRIVLIRNLDSFGSQLSFPSPETLYPFVISHSISSLRAPPPPPPRSQRESSRSNGGRDVSIPPTSRIPTIEGGEFQEWEGEKVIGGGGDKR